MNNFASLDSKFERSRRKKEDSICSQYLQWSEELLSGQVKPNRIFRYLADNNKMTIMGIKSILKRRGVYQNALNPVLVSDITSAAS